MKPNCTVKKNVITDTFVKSSSELSVIILIHGQTFTKRLVSINNVYQHFYEASSQMLSILHKKLIVSYQ